MKIQLTQNITFPKYTNIPTIQKGSVITLPFKEETQDYTITMEYQDRSFFFNNYTSLYYKTTNSNQIQGTLLNEQEHYFITDKQKGKITALTQAEFKLEEDVQVSLF